jgi:hypothetical protein
LKGARVVPLVGQSVAASVPEHVRIGRAVKVDCLATDRAMRIGIDVARNCPVAIARPAPRKYFTRVPE